MLMKDRSKLTAGHFSIRNILLVLGIILVASNLRASLTVVGPLVGTIREEAGLSSILAGLLIALPLIGFAVLSPLSPKLARRFGMEQTLLGCMVVLTAGILLRSVSSAVALFAGTALLGLALAVCNVLLPSLIKRDFPGNVGLMTGVYTVSMSIWAAFASGLSVPIAQDLGLGWRGSLVCWAILSVIGALAWLPQLKSRRQAAASRMNGAAISGLWNSPLAWQVTFFMGLQSMVFYVTVAWLPTILTDRGLSAASAGWMLSMMQFVGVPATFIAPVLAGRRPSQRSLATVIVLLPLIGYIGLLSGGTMLVTLWTMLIGLGLGASISLALTLLTLRTANAEQAAELSGMAQSVGYLLAAVGPILFGLLHDLTSSWKVPLLTLIAVIIVLLIVGLGAGRNEYVTITSKRQDEGISF
ncbi:MULTISPECIES: MFS transporter [unclassified Paenibacillus]|uniref:CynX/NimT family MFS transporter n=1 Tax=unclassified Paenibacillus TaxID=185978 RepID=UPI001B646370|nr:MULTISPECIES: MFS transporter [unclassified Paenibacillus]MBP1155345.1 CP family cyanate transporter-like MFS transporter [Paenibacillus sp. PvP091]MBP1169271.1 CP family cyanate transporter-like MFS transporter [Paenibacillus sp. PvR098]MBP2440298.1 CP family cyanate transporter-like MFS transporter [Paenibacillus sp. PvP052]